MGVDYTGNYGIGIKIFLPEFQEEDEWFEDELGWLEDILHNTEYSYFEVGEGSYTGKQDDLYIVIDNPFEFGYDIWNKVDELLKFLSSHEIGYEGEVDVVGGLRVW